MLHKEWKIWAKIQYAGKKTLVPSIDGRRDNSYVNNLWIDSYQLLFGSGAQSGLLSRLCGGFRVKSVKDRRTNENREKQGYDVHSGAEQERLPAADRVEG